MLIFTLALSYLHVRESHFGVTDVPMMFFAVCSMLFIVKSYYSKASLRNYVLAGVFAGLAASTKYNGVLVAVSMVAVHCLNVFEKEKAGWKGRRINNVGTWPSQPLVIVNYGGATGQEIKDFSEQIREAVDKEFGVYLEREVNIV